MLLLKRSFTRMEVLLAMLDTMPCLRMHPSEAKQKKGDESHKNMISLLV